MPPIGEISSGSMRRPERTPNEFREVPEDFFGTCTSFSSIITHLEEMKKEGRTLVSDRGRRYDADQLYEQLNKARQHFTENPRLKSTDNVINVSLAAMRITRAGGFRAAVVKAVRNL